MADLVSLQEVKKYLRIAKTSEHDDELNAIIPAVSEDIRRFTGFDWDTRAYTERRDGQNVRGLLALRGGLPGPPIVSVEAVTENGTALVVATQYSTSADVVVDLERGWFYRQGGTTPVSGGLASTPGLWCPGLLNVVLSYTTGYAVASIPADIKLPAKYAAGVFLKHVDAKWIGIQSRSAGQGSVSIIDELPALYLGMLERRRRVMVPAA